MLTRSQSVFLDLVRGFAAQCVLIGHAFSYSGNPLPATIQNLGVVLFFFLSGFLVTASAMRKTSFSEYFIDRFARMFTPYIPCLVLIICAGVLLDLPGPHDYFTFVANIAMLQDFPLHRYLPFLEFDRLGTGRPLWSVAMEWWFYMAFGGLFYWQNLPRWSLGLVFVGVFIVVFYTNGNSLVYLWAAGALGAYLWSSIPRAPWILLCSIGFYLCVARYPSAVNEFYDLTLGLLISFTVFTGLKTVANVSIPIPVARLAAGLAAYSYTLYLIHYTVMVSIPRYDGWLGIGAIFFSSNVVAIALYFLFERHYRVVSDRLKALLLRPAEL